MRIFDVCDTAWRKYRQTDVFRTAAIVSVIPSVLQGNQTTDVTKCYLDLEIKDYVVS